MSNKESANLIYEMQRSLDEVQSRFGLLKGSIKIDQKKSRLNELNEAMEASDFWDDQKNATNIQKEKVKIERELERIEEVETNLKDYRELIEFMKDDESSLLELSSSIKDLEEKLLALEMERMLNGPHDSSNAIVSINVGQGGVDSQDFSQMLLRMYKRYAERKNFSVKLMEYQPGEEAGIKSATVLISGEYAYGFLKSEVGVHRLVRISPFDSGARRHTSFASVWVIPEIAEELELEIKNEDLRVDTFRAGGAGGQHVNKTDSAVRITHLPTNTVVVCQAERSQIKNRSTALKILKARLYELEERKRLAERNKAEAQKLEASFGSQIRNYVMAPYRLVKDLRTNVEVGNVDAVLDGDLQPFIDAFLLKSQSKD